MPASLRACRAASLLHLAATTRLHSTQAAAGPAAVATAACLACRAFSSCNLTDGGQGRDSAPQTPMPAVLATMDKLLSKQGGGQELLDAHPGLGGRVTEDTLRTFLRAMQAVGASPAGAAAMARANPRYLTADMDPMKFELGVAVLRRAVANERLQRVQQAQQMETADATGRGAVESAAEVGSAELATEEGGRGLESSDEELGGMEETTGPLPGWGPLPGMGMPYSAELPVHASRPRQPVNSLRAALESTVSEMSKVGELRTGQGDQPAAAGARPQAAGKQDGQAGEQPEATPSTGTPVDSPGYDPSRV